MLGLAILSCSLAAGTCHPVTAPGAESFAVRIAAAPGSVVRLSALDVPRGWIASFCTPHVCAPFHVSFPIRSGTGTIALSFVPAAAHAAPLRTVHVSARSNASRSDARKAVR